VQPNEDGEGWYYFGARYYDADIALWTSVDPDGQFSSPYAYAGNGFNPINAFDLDGMDLGFFTSTNERNKIGHFTVFIKFDENSAVVGVAFDVGYADAESRLDAIKGTEMTVYGVVKIEKFIIKNGRPGYQYIDDKGKLQNRLFDAAYIKSITPEQDKAAGLAIASKYHNIKAGKERYIAYRKKSNTCVSAFTDAAKAIGDDFKRQAPNNTRREAVRKGYKKVEKW